jgi:hypothetical protein
LLLIGRGRPFGYQPFIVDDLFQAEQDLVGVDGFDQVIGDLAADGVVHEVLRLILGDQHDGRLLVVLFDLGQGFQTGDTRHVSSSRTTSIGFSLT